MATLSDIVNKRRVSRGGQLTEEDPQTIQQLSGQAGLTAPPLTPVGAGILGAGPDSQKMMGSPAQKQNALRMATEPTQELAATQRREQARTETTLGEAATQAKAQTLQELGSMGERVGSFIEAQRQRLVAAETPAVERQAVDTFQGTDLSAVKPLLAQLQANPTDMNLMLQVNQALGYDTNKQLSPAEINQLYQGATEAIASGAAGNVDNDLTASDLIASGLQYTPEQLSQLLEVPVEQVAGMTLGQIRNKVSELQQREFSSVQQLQQQATSGQLGVAERGLARGALREASATGMRSTEADVQRLQAQIDRADQVSFGGKQYSVDQLLSDETISSIVSDYLNSAPGSEARKQLEATEPALIQFINQNQTLLTEAAQQLEQGAGQFQQIQEANKQLATVGGITMDPTVANAVIPGYGELQATEINRADVPLLAVADALPPADQTRLMTEISTTAAQNPEMAQELGNLTQAQIEALNIASPRSDSNWNKYKRATEQAREFQTAATADELMPLLFSDVADYQSLVEQAETDYIMDVLGGVGGTSNKLLRDVRDPANPSKVLDEATLLEKMRDAYSQPSLADASRGDVSLRDRVALGNGFQPNAVERSLMKKMGPLAQDGVISLGELTVMGTDYLNTDELLWLVKRGQRGNIESAAYRKLEKQLTRAQDNNTQRLIDKAFRKYGEITTSAGGNTTNLNEYIRDLNVLYAELKGDPHYNADIVAGILEKLQGNKEGAAKQRGKTHSANKKDPVPQGIRTAEGIAQKVASPLEKKATSDIKKKVGF